MEQKSETLDVNITCSKTQKKYVNMPPVLEPEAISESWDELLNHFKIRRLPGGSWTCRRLHKKRRAWSQKRWSGTFRRPSSLHLCWGWSGQSTLTQSRSWSSWWWQGWRPHPTRSCQRTWGLRCPRVSQQSGTPGSWLVTQLGREDPWRCCSYSKMWNIFSWNGVL